MKKTAIVMVFAAFMCLGTKAQTIQEGINDLNAQRYQSARTLFTKLITANPNNIDATYWLGQTMIANSDIPGAQALYQKFLSTNGNAPLVLVGMGSIDLLQGRAGEGRQKFEAAITASKGRKGNDPNVLNAIGKANADAYSDDKHLGDLDYAIAKLNEAGTLAPTNPDIFLNLGNAYRKKHMGTEAVQAYRKAGNYAPALYRTAMLYRTQMTNANSDWSIVLDNLNQAVAADQRFAPAYEQLYYYNLQYKRDFATAETFANKVVSSSDPSVENDYLKAQTIFVQNKFADAITIAKNIIAQTNNNAKPRVYRLLAYSYLGTKDTATACDYSNQFFTKAKEEDINGQDYLLNAESCGKGNPDVLRRDIQKAISMDSVPSRQQALLSDEIAKAHANGQSGLEGELMLMSYNLRGASANPASLVSIGIPFYFAGQFQRADSVFQVYNKAFPDSIYGYLWQSRSLAQQDTAMTQGLAVPAYEQLLRVSALDKARFKAYGVQAAGYLAAYYYNTKADKASAIDRLNKGLEIDPGNASLTAVKTQLENARPAPQRSATPATKPKTTTKPVKH